MELHIIEILQSVKKAVAVSALCADALRPQAGRYTSNFQRFLRLQFNPLPNQIRFLAKLNSWRLGAKFCNKGLLEKP
jgi:hypothetical protein